MTSEQYIRALFSLGSNIHPVECVVAYVLPFLFLLSDATALKELLCRNCIYQVCIFLPLVQLPLAVTGKMAYVDIGWPLGLTVLGITGLTYGEGWYIRKVLFCGFMVLHGSRMLLGALALFYPYTFKNGDLSRYQYAKHKWIVEEGLSPALWPVKAQLDTLTQCFANSLILACPVLLSASNPTPHFHMLEIFGGAIWATAWIMENMADLQKMAFLAECKRLAKEAAMGRNSGDDYVNFNNNKKVNESESDRLKFAVLGYVPFNSSAYWLWTKCRHPNYFFEWSAWVGFACIGSGSVLTKDAWLVGGSGWTMSVLLYATFALMLRFFYDCLVYWTGSGPAERSSVTKRPAYREYQQCTRVFFPFPVPSFLVDHHMQSGWPGEKEVGSSSSSNSSKSE